MKAFLRSIVLTMLAMTPLEAQRRVALPAGWPDAATVLQRFKAGDQNTPYWHVIGMCPEDSPYGRVLWDALLAERATPELVLRLSPSWRAALRRCNDPRLDAWYRQRLVEFRHDRFLAAMILVPSLAGHPTQENLGAIRRYVFDESVDAEDRSVALYALGINQSWERRMDLYFETYQNTRVMPEPYAVNTFWNLIRSPVADRFVRQSLEIVERDPEGSNAARLLNRVAMHPDIEKNRTWKSQVETVLARIEANPSGRFPRDLVATARSARDQLRATPNQ